MPLARSETQSRESEADPDTVLSYLKCPCHIPLWAPDFAENVTPDGLIGWKVSKNGESFRLRVAVSLESGTVDYLRQVAPGRETGAYIRVVPRLGGGSVIIMTLPLPPSADPLMVTATLKRELAALVEQLELE